ncbi:unnamed protein product [Amoebophrya sp. A25]|nr:unnamed protein product [Amoebophrya sp. A25]|eukprot:GSA25T00000651001.1
MCWWSSKCFNANFFKHSREHKFNLKQRSQGHTSGRTRSALLILILQHGESGSAFPSSLCLGQQMFATDTRNVLCLSPYEWPC